ncbi:MAG: LysM peptidoglycan-binding domain-containing protein [Planctomycetota bacterium]|jgi:LysM repeat protein
MGNIGGIEKVMVFGILVIILTILGVAIYSASKVENDLTPNQLKAAGSDKMVAIIEPTLPKESKKTTQSSRSTRPLFKDILPQRSQANQELLKSNNSLNATNNPPLPTGNKNQSNGAQDYSPAGMGPHQPATALKPEAKKKAEQAIREYEVKQGDSFSSIARNIYGDDRMYKVLMAANPDIDPLNLQIGQKIKIPPLPTKTEQYREQTADGGGGVKEKKGKTYVIKAGDTLVKISQALYGTSKRWRDIYTANRDVISDPDYLQVGVELKIP